MTAPEVQYPTMVAVIDGPSWPIVFKKSVREITQGQIAIECSSHAKSRAFPVTNAVNRLRGRGVFLASPALG